MAEGNRMVVIKVPVRYLSAYRGKQERFVESSVRYEEDIMEIDVRESAIILVDIWDRHVNKSHFERCTEIVENKVAPLLEVARQTGTMIIHAPGRGIAEKYPQWVRYAGDEEIAPAPRRPPRKPSGWPPEDFRKPLRLSAQRRFHADEKTRSYYQDRFIHDTVKPKPEDFVIATGRQLQRLLRDQRILHLFYAGFATNICLMNKDYGIRAMGGKGYNIILLRDCTTGIETSYTVEGLLATKTTIQQIETHHSSTTSEEVIRACEALLKKNRG